MSGISEQGYGQRDNTYSRTWVRTRRTVEYWAELADVRECAGTADDVSQMVVDNTGMQIMMQANGWATVPDGCHDFQVADAVDTAIGVLEDIAADEARASAE